MENTQQIPARFYYKSEICSFYGFSRTTFYKNLHRDDELMYKLEETGYNTNQKQLTKKQVEIIFEAWGWPELKQNTRV